MPKNNTVRLPHHTRVIERHDGSYFIIVETDNELKRLKNGMNTHNEVSLSVGRGGIIRLLPFGSNEFVHLPQGSVFPIRTEGAGAMKFIK